MSNTPFIDSLSKEKREYVAKYAKIPRPSYYNASLENVEATANNNSSIDVDNSAISTSVEISKDLEAALILMSKDDKSKIIGILSSLSTKLQPSEELDLMEEVLATRADSYNQISIDITSVSIGSIAQSFERTRSSIINMLINTPLINDDGTKKDVVLGDEPTAVLIPDLGRIFNAINIALADFSKPEIMAVHDRVVDQLTVFHYRDSGLRRQKELSSWISVVQAYLTQ